MPSSRHASESSLVTYDEENAYVFSRGRKVTSLGVIFNFTSNDHNTTVQPVGEMIKEAWVGYTIYRF